MYTALVYTIEDNNIVHVTIYYENTADKKFPHIIPMDGQSIVVLIVFSTACTILHS